MHDLPGAAFRSKDARRSQGHRSDVLPAANPDLELLYLHNVGKLRSHVLRHVLKGNDLAVSVQGSSTLHCRGNLHPPTGEGPKWVTEADIFPLRKDQLVGLGVPFYELACREVILPDNVVKII